ncbi:hypothetical protein IQ268_16795 [Oculatella sp. LEGE 06141]|uniref:hypothetical protein n=1 Tax=Oculatella sp. LEGE 06141 TaxID=1828648 RepID=UPI001882F7E9|nr:hypothetical protein [Oculatella sp. LEGE 06141]MBE9180223.1 hypothetical protein [Oculatella sp. LEGE 06141]
MKQVVLAYQQFNRLPKLIRIMCFGFAIALVQTGFSIASLVNSTSDRNGFVKAETVVPKSILEKAIAENSIEGNALNSKTVKALEIVGQDSNLFVFDFNTSELCGKAGCLYSIYSEGGNQLLNTYLFNNVPERFEVFEVNGSAEGLPCLLIHQPDPERMVGEALIVVSEQYCYQGHSESLVKLMQQKQSIQQ